MCYWVSFCLLVSWLKFIYYKHSWCLYFVTLRALPHSWSGTLEVWFSCIMIWLDQSYGEMCYRYKINVPLLHICIICPQTETLKGPRLRPCINFLFLDCTYSSLQFLNTHRFLHEKAYLSSFKPKHEKKVNCLDLRISSDTAWSIYTVV